MDITEKIDCAYAEALRRSKLYVRPGEPAFIIMNEKTMQDFVQELEDRYKCVGGAPGGGRKYLGLAFAICEILPDGVIYCK